MPGETHPPGPRSDLAGEASSLAALVRHHDRDRYQTALFAPARRREALLALYAFNYEIARVRETVTQPMLGQIRLQWWREVLDAAYAGAPARQHPVAVPLSAVIREFGLSREPFDRLIDTRERDLAVIRVAASFEEARNPEAAAQRNQALIDKADVVAAFWDGSSRGTRGTIDRALDSGKEVHVFIDRIQ